MVVAGKKFSVIAERDYRRTRIELSMTHATSSDVRFMVDMVKNFKPYWHETKEEESEVVVKRNDENGGRTVSFESSMDEESVSAK